jgi:glycosyltransferase involved in cell wall biosynthesis
MTPGISLYIPCFNVEAYIAPVIEGVLAQTLPADEVLIVDDGSSDRTLEIARRYPVTIVRHDQNRGLAAARNTGIHRARNEFVAALDADCVPDPAWLGTLAAAISEPRTVMVGGKLIETVLASAADRWRQSHMPQDWGETRTVNPKFTFGSNTLARKSALEEVGWYDERMRTNGEDVDISRRLRVRGYDSVYEPGAIVRHLRHDSVTSVMNAYWRWWRFGVKAYANGVRLSSIVATFYRAHFRTSFLQCLGQDLRQRKVDLLPLDVFMLAYMPYRDVRLYFETRANTRASHLSSEVKTP